MRQRKEKTVEENDLGKEIDELRGKISRKLVDEFVTRPEGETQKEMDPEILAKAMKNSEEFKAVFVDKFNVPAEKNQSQGANKMKQYREKEALNKLLEHPAKKLYDSFVEDYEKLKNKEPDINKAVNDLMQEKGLEKGTKKINSVSM